MASDIPESAITAAAAAIERELMSGTGYSMAADSDEALARVALEAAAPLLSDESPKVRERARYWSEAVSPLRDLAEEIDETLEGIDDPVILREMLARARDTITRCVG